ncbi:nucleotidyltransferase family protein [Methylobacterium sp. J-067]|uniref:nucleotidyltransferase family protein n=1 Tax=Methylobacterium sp. J-067 TaxID=2836648 RepID=UPI001FB8E9A7|nr:nucleotidyltransferase domain-containing protein [Methylobacterium sp. J-067]MCJ2027460.1 nucleotidyltransferase domain-containing protein [Methylobacterium sp. J-067]
MNRDAALAILRAHEPELRQRGVRHAALFGSVARGEEGPDSDLDVMIDIDVPTVGGVFGFVGLCHYIDDLFPIRVDVLDRRALKDRIRARAEVDAVEVF